MEHSSAPFSIPAMHHFIPDKLRPWIVILFVIVFQLSGGIYLASVSEMIGSLALMQEDILMAGYSSLVGMSLTFAIMFRLKFAFKPKTSLLICCAAIIICNVICMHTANLPILIFTCFISGVFRMWGTFECNSTIQLWLTPKRDLSVFFCYIYLLVQGTMLLSGITTNYISIISKWEYMHYFVIILLFIVMLLVMLIYNNKRFIKRLPLYGIDWTGAILWGVTILSMIFVGLYGEYYDWWSSEWIVLGTIIAILSLSVNIIRASFIRHPFISNSLWNYKIIWIVILLYFIYDLLLSPSHLLEHIYLSDILGYDEYHINTLNWIGLIGIVLGSYFSYLYFAKYKLLGYRYITLIAFVSITLYLLVFYFIIDYNLPKEMLFLPILLRSFGYVLLSICLITSLTRLPFNIFFNGIAVNGFVGAGLAGVFGSAVLVRLFKITFNKNIMLISSHIDNSYADVNINNIFMLVKDQALIVSLKELYGWLSFISIIILFLIIVIKIDINPRSVILPTYKAIRRFYARIT